MNSNSNLEDLFNNFLIHLEIEKDISKNTRSSYLCDFNLFKQYLGQQNISPDLSNIDKALLKNYFHFLKFTKGYSTSSMRRKTHSMSSFFKYLYEEDIIENNPMKSIKAPKRPKTLPIYIKDEDVVKLISLCDKIGEQYALRDKCFFLLLFLTGVRRDELINIRWKDVDFSTNTLTVMKGKGNKTRIIPIISPLDKYLKKLFESKITDKHNYVLYSHTLNRLSKSSATTLFNKYLVAADLLGLGYTLHKCRHTFATNLAIDNVDSFAIASLLGHEDLDTTKVYVHLSQGKLKNKVQETSYAKKINTLITDI